MRSGVGDRGGGLDGSLASGEVETGPYFFQLFSCSARYVTPAFRTSTHGQQPTSGFIRHQVWMFGI